MQERTSSHTGQRQDFLGRVCDCLCASKSATHARTQACTHRRTEERRHARTH
jgi:hypothetical protein